MNEGLLIGRLLMGLPFIWWGIGKIRGGEAHLIPVLTAMGLHDAKFLAYMVGVCELFGGIMVVLGYPAHTAAILLGLWCLATALTMQKQLNDTLLSHVVMAGGFFTLAAVGPGSIALFGGHPTGLFVYLP